MNAIEVGFSVGFSAPTSTAITPFIQTTHGWFSRMLAKHNIKSVSLPPRKIYSYVPPVKDAFRLWTPGVYSIHCECGPVYIGQSDWSIQIRIKKQSRHTWLAQTEKSAVAEPRIFICIIFQRNGTQKLFSKSHAKKKTLYQQWNVQKENEQKKIFFLNDNFQYNTKIKLKKLKFFFWQKHNLH